MRRLRRSAPGDLMIPLLTGVRAAQPAHSRSTQRGGLTPLWALPALCSLILRPGLFLLYFTLSMRDVRVQQLENFV